MIPGDPAANRSIPGLPPSPRPMMTKSFCRLLLIPALFALPASAQMRLNEFMAANDSTAVPGAVTDTFNDWIELFNEGNTAVDLGGWHLTDNSTNPTKWTFPAGVIIPAGGFRIIFASGGNGPDANGNLHTNFSLSAAGEYLGLFQPGGVPVDEFGTGGSSYPPQDEDVSYGRKPGDGSPVYFGTATPGAPNAADGYLRVAAVQTSVNRGFYSASFTVTLSTATSQAVIYYTTDGSTPLQTNGSPAPTASVYGSPVAISTTTVLRSAATRPGYEPTTVNTQTYLFPAAVATQQRPASYSTTWGSGNTADYDVDPAVSLSAADASRFQSGLRSLPTLSVATTADSLFGPSGIYTLSTNDTLEAAVSAEYFQPSQSGDGALAEPGFQIDCGLKVQGGSSRNFSSTAKHSFSLRFRREYGAGKLDYDLFGPPAVDSFNSVQLRAMYNNSWTHSDANQRARATMIRDQWMRDSLIAMGQADGGHGRYVNLYLNGLFWGVYNLHERLDNDQYAAYREDVNADDIFGFNPGDSTTAEQTSLNQMRAAVTSGNWASIEERLDVNSYVDYYIMQHFGRNDDLKTNGNWRAAGGGAGNHPWRFYLWDSERTLENPGNTSELAVSQDGASIITGLDHLPEFQARFADRAWKHLTHGGALENARNRERFLARVGELDEAITGESARWGDWRTGGGGPTGDYTRDDNWLRALYGPLGPSPRGGVLGNTNSWFPETGNSNRTQIILAAWKTQVWEGTAVTKLPAIDPPAFTVNNQPQHGGYIPPGGTLRLTGGTGQIYVTTDGSDPRQTGGAPKAGLQTYAPGSAIPLQASSTVRTRWYDGVRWSALNEAVFLVEPPAVAGNALRITEIHYHPAPPSPLEEVAAASLTPPKTPETDDFQFLEIANIGPEAVNLSGTRLTGGVTLEFGNVPLPPGAAIFVVEDAAAFALRYGTGLNPSGTWNGALSRSGEQIALVDANGAVITSVTYSDSGEWPSRADGDGSSLEMIEPTGLPDDPQNWRSSIAWHGSPGRAGAAADGRVLVNEVLTHTDPPLEDAIELVNTTGSPVNLSGWFLSDTKSNYRKFRIPEGTMIPAGGYVVLDAADFDNPAPQAITGYSGAAGALPVTVTSASHGLSTGDTITISGYGGFGLYNATFQIKVTGADTFTIPTSFLDNHPTQGTWTAGQPFALNSYEGEDVWLMEGTAGGELVGFVDRVSFPATLNGESMGRWPNAAGPLVPMLSRTLGDPNSSPRTGPVVLSEIMVHPSGSPESDFEFVEIWNPTSSPVNMAGWTLRGDVDFDFTNQTLPPDGRLVVVGFNPSSEARTTAFLSAWNTAAPIVFAGPWSSGDALGNSIGTVRLRRADEPPAGLPNFYPQVIEDEVNYSTADPWPLATSSSGQSLHRNAASAFGNDGTSWTAAAATPGKSTNPAPSGYDAWAAENNLAGSPQDDPDRDGIPNLVEYLIGSNPAAPNGNQLPQPIREGASLTFTWQKVLNRTDVSGTVESSVNLSTWTPVPDLSVSTAGGIETRRATIPITPGVPRVYLRLRAVR